MLAAKIALEPILTPGTQMSYSLPPAYCSLTCPDRGGSSISDEVTHVTHLISAESCTTTPYSPFCSRKLENFPDLQGLPRVCLAINFPACFLPPCIFLSATRGQVVHLALGLETTDKLLQYHLEVLRSA